MPSYDYLPFIYPDITGIHGLLWIVEYFIADLFTATAGEAESVFKEKRIVFVEPVCRETEIFLIQMSETCYWSVVLATVEIIGSQKIILQTGN